MIRLALSFMLVVLLQQSLATAQADVTPVLKTSLNEKTAIPGQPLIFRITILVPTWMPQPPVFPSLEVPNVVVRLPSRASSPTSERVNGETWSGITRTYRLYPMVPGTFQIPGGPVKVTFSDPNTRDPIETEVMVGPFEIVGEVPPEAKDLTPFVAATGLSLKRTVEADLENLNAGDAILVTSEVSVEGILPMFVPPMDSNTVVDGLSIYPKEPVLAETEDRGAPSGSRTEVMTIVPEFAGTYQIPEIEISWFDLTDNQIRTESAPAIEFNVSGAALKAKEDEADPLLWRKLALLTFVSLTAALAIGLILRTLVPWFRRILSRARAQFYGTEPCKYLIYRSVLRKRNYNRALSAGHDWRKAVADAGGDIDWRNLDCALAELGRVQFGGAGQKQEVGPIWRSVVSASTRARRAFRAKRLHDNHKKLPALNP